MNLSKLLGHNVDKYGRELPISEPGLASRIRLVRRTRLRQGGCLRLLVSSLAAGAVLWACYRLWMEHIDPRPVDTPMPLYKEYHERERNLPQHNPSLAYPDGAHAKFLWADNHEWEFEWGDYMQEMLLNAYLAYAARRAYVFDNYTWERDGPEIVSWYGYSMSTPTRMPARIPLSAFISGPIVGGRMRDPEVPRAISREYYLSVCPESERVILDTRKIQDALHSDATVIQIVDRWVTELHSIQSPCVQLARDSPALFSPKITTTKRVLDVFPALSKSPILSDFGWSPLTLLGFYNNLKYFASSDFGGVASMAETSIAPLRGLLAVHIRRGDYETWCIDNSTSFKGFNSFPELPDTFSLPSSPENTRKRCYPSISEVVEKILAVNAPHITRVYVMTNAARPWLADLKDALRTAHAWVDGVGTSRDLQLSLEGQFVAEGVDMYVGQRAERFIGNGFSSLTANIVALRMNNPDLRSSDTHFW